MARYVADGANEGELYLYTGEEPLEEVGSVSWSDLRPRAAEPPYDPAVKERFPVLAVLSTTQGSRHSGDLYSRSNYDAILAKTESGGELEDAEVFEVYGLDDSYGLAFRADSQDDDLIRIITGLGDYPIYDEEHLGAAEMDAQDEAWESWAREEYLRVLREAAEAKRDVDPENPWEDLIDLLSERTGDDEQEDAVYALFEIARQRANADWEVEGHGVRISMQQVKEDTTTEDMLEVLGLPQEAVDFLGAELSAREAVFDVLEIDPIPPAALWVLIDALYMEAVQPTRWVGPFDEQDLARRWEEHRYDLMDLDAEAIADSLSADGEQAYIELADRWVTLRAPLEALYRMEELDLIEARAILFDELEAMQEAKTRVETDPDAEEYRGRWVNRNPVERPS